MTWIQIIDDDHWCGEAIIANLMPHFSTATFEIKDKPIADDGRDVYIVDNEFETNDYGVDLVQSIRRRNPDALIVLCTGTHERIDLSQAMNAGCNAIVEKGTALGRKQLAEFIELHTQRVARSAVSPNIFSVIADIKSIIAAWNARLNQESTSALIPD